MSLETYIKEAFKVNYNNIRNHIPVSDIIVSITHKNNEYPIRCLVQFGFIRNENHNVLDVSLDFDRSGAMGQHSLTSNFKHSTEDFRFDDFTTGEIAKIFTDIDVLTNDLKELIIRTYNNLHP